MVSLPTILHPRTTGLTRWIESLFDGVMEILPFLSRPFQPPKDSSGKEEAPQGMLRIYQLPILHEKGGSFFEADGLEGDLAFTLSRRKGLVMKPFTLPPVEGEEEHEHGGHADAGKAKKADLEF
jgi:elongator complex protein 4